MLKKTEIDYDKISQRHKVKNTRLTLEFLVEMIENKWTIKEILENYPQINKEDIIHIMAYKNNYYNRKNMKNLFQEIFKNIGV